MKSFTTAATEAASGENKAENVEVEIDGRVLTFMPPTPGQLTFMMAALGRGQTNDQRFASIINIITECLGKDDKDYFEARLLVRENPIDIKTLEGIFEYIMGEWFGRPTKQPSDSASSQSNGGQNSTATTTPSLEGSSDSTPTDS